VLEPEVRRALADKLPGAVSTIEAYPMQRGRRADLRARPAARVGAPNRGGTSADHARRDGRTAAEEKIVSALPRVRSC